MRSLLPGRRTIIGDLNDTCTIPDRRGFPWHCPAGFVGPTAAFSLIVWPRPAWLASRLTEWDSSTIPGPKTDELFGYTKHTAEKVPQRSRRCLAVVVLEDKKTSPKSPRRANSDGSMINFDGQLIFPPPLASTNLMCLET